MKNFIYTSCISRNVLINYENIGLDYIKNTETRINDERILCKFKGFNLSEDGKNKMLNLVFSDLAIFDWDVHDGIEKDKVIEILNRFLKYSPDIKDLKIKTLCFKIFETDNGIHAYLVSQKLNHREDKCILLKNALLTDVNHNLLCYKYGHITRITQKKEGQFIQKPSFSGVLYVGNIKSINPELDSLTDLIYRAQQFILSGKVDICNFLSENS